MSFRKPCHMPFRKLILLLPSPLSGKRRGKRDFVPRVLIKFTPTQKILLSRQFAQ